ncbi:hypothetical protein D3C84_1277670 [compost metagenome]
MVSDAVNRTFGLKSLRQLLRLILGPVGYHHCRRMFQQQRGNNPPSRPAGPND